MTVKSEKKHVITEDSKQLKAVIDSLGSMFSDLSTDARFNSELLDINLKGLFAQEVAEIIKDPLKSSFQSLKMMESTIINMLKSIVKSFLDEHKSIINSVYIALNQNNILHYSIVLNNYSLKNKSVFNGFINDYETTSYAMRFPIVFQIIPDILVDEFEKELDSDKFGRIDL